ncbi:MAG: hypothetical protein ACJ780_28770 [Solirubrobacteraceae bacterium]
MIAGTVSRLGSHESRDAGMRRNANARISGAASVATLVMLDSILCAWDYSPIPRPSSYVPPSTNARALCEGALSATGISPHTPTPGSAFGLVSLQPPLELFLGQARTRIGIAAVGLGSSSTGLPLYFSGIPFGIRGAIARPMLFVRRVWHSDRLPAASGQKPDQRRADPQLASQVRLRPNVLPEPPTAAESRDVG